MRKVLIFGATSAIVQEVARLFAKDGAALFLVARNAQRLASVANDLRVRGASLVETLAMDLNDLKGHEGIVQSAAGVLGEIDAVLIGHGELPNQSIVDHSGEEVARTFTSNCVSVLSLVTHVATFMERKKRGLIAVISSVAGDRGRRSNYAYGAAKGAVNIFLDGLRGRLHGSGVRILTIKPGPVNSPMTASMPKNILFSEPRPVGEGIYRAMKTGKEVVYLPSYWRWIMALIKLIPDQMFRRMTF
jgi:decaprenylphospho-beta-D-erythro-pentofuranosid-2-ulose 2-reductase